jgi:hypothetical protein
MMDEELLAVNEQAQHAVPMPDCLHTKFAVSKKEVAIQDKYIIGADILAKGTRDVGRTLIKLETMEMKIEETKSTCFTPKMMLEDAFGDKKDNQ